MFRPLFRIFIILQVTSVVLSVPAALLLFSDSDLGLMMGFLFLGVALPSLTGWILLLSHVLTRKTRGQIDETILATWKYSEDEWKDWIAFTDREEKGEVTFLAIAFFVAGIGATWLNLIPATWWEGATIGAILGIFTVFLRKIITQGYRFANTDEGRIIKVAEIGAQVGYLTHYWHKDQGEVLDISWMENTNTILPVVQISYVRTTYNKNTGAQRNPQYLKIPVPKGQEEVVDTWIRRFQGRPFGK